MASSLAPVLDTNSQTVPQSLTDFDGCCGGCATTSIGQGPPGAPGQDGTDGVNGTDGSSIAVYTQVNEPVAFDGDIWIVPGVSASIMQGGGTWLSLTGPPGPAGSGAGATVQVSGDPNGVVTATTPAIGYDEPNGAVWVKTGVGSTNTGWVKLIG